jgi:hypothetical protein
MRAFEILIEASGLRAGRPGEIYVDTDGVEYKFQNWEFEFPLDHALLKYETPEDMQAEINQITNGDTKKIRWVNGPGRGKSFALAKFASDDGKEIWVGKYFATKSSNNTIFDKEATTFAGLTPGGNKSSVIKAESKLKPLDLGIADGKSRSVPGIIKSVSGHEKSQSLTQALNSTVSGGEVTFAGGGSIVSAIQDDFCEVLAPVAMISNHPSVKGHLTNAVADVFKGDTLEGASINFPASLTNNLIDSYIVKNGITLGVSSKGKKGAKATITNIFKAKEEAAQNPTGQAYIKKFKFAVEILDICQKQSGLEQPITLGMMLGIINSTEETSLRTILNDPRNQKYQLTGNPTNLNAVVTAHTKEDLAKVPRALLRLFKMGGYKAGSFVGFICLARLAYLVAERINVDTKIKFGEAIRSFLNSSAMVQANSIVSAKGTDAVLKSINIVYPPNFTEKAKIEANGYSGKQVKGKFSFSLPTT